MKTLKDVKVGDLVVMRYIAGRMSNGQVQDRFVRAVVTSAKPVNVTAEEVNNASSRKRTWTFRRDTRKESRNDGHYGWVAYTVEEHEDRQRVAAADEVLRSQGIRLDANSPWRAWTPELADLISRHLEGKKAT